MHVSTHDELPLIEEAKRKGLKTTAEVTPQHLFFHAPDCYDRLGAYAQMNPPIRSEEHRQGLWEALRAGLFDVFGSDHAPHTRDEKGQVYPLSPSGMPGVQTMLPVLLNFVNQGMLTIADVVRMGCENPATIYGIAHKGRLEEGYDADLTFVDMDKAEVISEVMMQSKCGWTPYEGVRLQGWPVHTMLRGRLIIRDNLFMGRPAGEPVQFLWK